MIRAAALALLLIAPPALADELRFAPDALHARDGDDLSDGQTRIRLAGIDAPEMPGRQGQAARAALAALIEGRAVRCTTTEFDDRFGRFVGSCVAEGVGDLARALVAAGLASDWPKYPPSYRKAERTAARNRAGLWARGGPDTRPAKQRTE